MSGSQFGGCSSSRKGKKTGSQSSDKPKQPQRGLGVAQLEKIRLHNQMEEMNIQAFAAMQTSMGGAPPSSHFSYPPSQYVHQHNFMMGMEDLERSQQRFGESQAHTQPWWNPNPFPDYPPPGVATRHLLNRIEDSGQGLRNDCNIVGSSSQNSGESQDLDLELKL